ncbi:hypothetical protein [Brevibacterium luteolum]|uniref:Uncharacterized protein n=1 Tax=Brevibacterium luteolum TaxID=199591 RepID=A0A849ASF6_9MICO|nr:hypothetical protein [Brevibacterium luteolum]MBM7528737.1 hypothetical protein [Brevibacterium luteolum]MCT1921030.1 ARC6/PARC6 family protein [Brevibacterium luteolum]NNG79061.1 hypothetical protein [Brevibacterium luteolum]
MAEQTWHTVAEVAPGIRRISTGQRTAWFLPEGDVADITHRWPGIGTAELTGGPVSCDPATVPEAEGTRASDVASVDGQPAHVLGQPRQAGGNGLIVPRFHGGLLVDALRSYAGLTLGQTLAVLGACLEALCAAPEPSSGRLRCHRSAFGVDDAGAIHLVPGHTVPVESVSSEAVEFGQLAYLCLTGLTWEEHGVPVPDLTPAVPEPLAGIIIELLEAEPGGGPAPGPELLTRLAAMGEPEQIPFVPVEAEVSVSEAVTAQLRVDASVASALTGRYERSREHTTGGQREKRAHRVEDNTTGSGIGRLRAAAGHSGRDRMRRKDSTQHTAATRRKRQQKRPARQERDTGSRALRLPRLPLNRTMLIGAAAALVLSLSGIALLTGLIDPRGEAVAPGSAGHNPPSDQATEGPAATTASGPENPKDAFAALTRRREQAYHLGDAAALAELTVAGSPAAAADGAADVEAFQGSDISIDIESAQITQQEADRAELDVATRTQVSAPDGSGHDYGSVRMRVELRREDGSWRVYDAIEQS